LREYHRDVRSSGMTPNNPLKLPLALLGLAVACALMVVGITQGSWVLIVVGVAAFALFAAQARVIRQGRNPWWNRALADYSRRSSG
jgi:hypothetical protein